MLLFVDLSTFQGVQVMLSHPVVILAETFAVVAVPSDRWSLNFHGASAENAAVVARIRNQNHAQSHIPSLPRNQYSGRKERAESLVFHVRCLDGNPVP